MTDNVSESAEPPLKILMTTDAVGGVWQYSIDLVAALVERGAEILVTTMGQRPSDAQRQQLLKTPRITLAESDFALEWMPAPWHDVDRAGKWLVELASDFRADIIHLNGYSHANLTWRKPVIVTAHSCVYSWWRAVHGSSPGQDWAEYKRRVVEGLAASDIVTTPSAFMAGALQQEYGVPGEKICVIHNFSRAARSARKPKQPFLLAAGRMWDPAKNFRLIEQIAPKLNYEIRVAGSCPRPDARAATTKSARLLGSLSQPQLLDEMERASIFLHPALYEPFGLAVLEAASRRCCLVLSDIPSLRELWAGAAVFIDPHNPEQWAVELNKLMADRATREAFSRGAYLRANEYGADAAIRKYWSLYRSLISSNRPGKKDAAA
jgi:glycogen synthase